MVDLAKLEPNGAEMRAIRGGEIALIFQEPMTSFSPVHTVGNQIIEAILLHQRVDSARGARTRARRAAATRRHPDAPSSASTSTPFQLSRRACASGR